MRCLLSLLVLIIINVAVLIAVRYARSENKEEFVEDLKLTVRDPQKMLSDGMDLITRYVNDASPK